MRFILPLLVLAFTSSVSLYAQEEAPPKYPPEYVEQVRESMRAFQTRNFEATLAALDKADALHPATPTTLNIRGAVAIEQKRFDEGRKYCNDVLKLDPKFFPAKFNLAEIPFLQKKYDEAGAEFQKLKEEYPKDELVSFRIFMCKLLGKDEAGAKEMLEAIPFLSDSPIYYYTHAAWDFSHGREAEAIKWVQSGNWVFSPERTTNYADVFFDLGWLKRDAPPAAVAPNAGALAPSGAAEGTPAPSLAP